MRQLDGKVAVVTGGGRGIGRCHALALAAEGAAVLVNDFGGAWSGDGGGSDGPAADVVAEITGVGGRAAMDTTDVSNWDAAASVVDTALQAFGRLDIVVNNAGITRFGTIDVISRQDWEQTIAVNLSGTGALCHWAAAHWRKEGPENGRRIINTSSGVGLGPIPNNPMYVAAKSGVASLTIACAVELADLGVRANALAPVARTRISEEVAGDLMNPPATGFDRMDPANVSPVVVYLASPACAFTGRVFGIIGDSLTVYEGWTVSQHFDNGDDRWTVDGVATVLAGVPPQYRSAAQAIVGVEDALTPPSDVVEALAAVEHS
jgi:NAD(P)-dependent dehydrogenase (short-subunit alcohol dehydrogenase family)